MFKPLTLPQPEVFVPAGRLVRSATAAFSDRLEQTRRSLAFAAQVRERCSAAAFGPGKGRSGGDPVVYFKMLMVGFFENLSSERGLAQGVWLAVNDRQ